MHSSNTEAIMRLYIEASKTSQAQAFLTKILSNIK